MNIIDTRGMQCPAPIIAARKALRETVAGDMFRLLTDSKTSLDNLTRFLNDNKAEFTVEEAEGEWMLDIRKGISEVKAEVKVEDKVEMYCDATVPHFSKGNFIVVFSSDKMGEGDEDLGEILMSNFIKAIKDLEKLPSEMVFYKSGVKLLTPDSPVSEYIADIENMGVRILVCSTCVKYFSLVEKIRTGTLSNMYEIAQVMASAGHIVKP